MQGLIEMWLKRSGMERAENGKIGKKVARAYDECADELEQALSSAEPVAWAVMKHGCIYPLSVGRRRETVEAFIEDQSIPDYGEITPLFTHPASERECATSMTTETERERFERIMRDEIPYYFDKPDSFAPIYNGSLIYKHDVVHCAWIAWKAALRSREE